MQTTATGEGWPGEAIAREMLKKKKIRGRCWLRGTPVGQQLLAEFAAIHHWGWGEGLTG